MNYIDDAIAYLDLMEPFLRPLLEDDPNNQLTEPVPEYFDNLRTWLQDRADNVADQLCMDGFC